MWCGAALVLASLACRPRRSELPIVVDHVVDQSKLLLLFLQTDYVRAQSADDEMVLCVTASRMTESLKADIAVRRTWAAKGQFNDSYAHALVHLETAGAEADYCRRLRFQDSQSSVGRVRRLFNEPCR